MQQRRYGELAGRAFLLVVSGHHGLVSVDEGELQQSLEARLRELLAQGQLHLRVNVRVRRRVDGPLVQQDHDLQDELFRNVGGVRQDLRAQDVDDLAVHGFVGHDLVQASVRRSAPKIYAL